MKRTPTRTQQTGLLASSDLVRPRPHGRSIRPVHPPEPVISIDFGDTADAVDPGWRSWVPHTPRAA